MDMWQAFRTSTRHHAPQAAILFDKFHVLRHLSKALDTIRKREYGPASRQAAYFHQGSEIYLAGPSAESHRQRPQEPEAAARGQQASQHRVPAEGILQPAVGLQQRGLGQEVLRELARAVEMSASETLRDFADMIERHWDGIAAYCKPENKVSLGFVEGLNNKIRVLQRRAYGLRDEEYLRLKILTCHAA